MTEPVSEPVVTAPVTEPAKTFSQEEVNALMGKVRQESKAQYADYAALKERAKKADELEQAQMSATEKLELAKAKAERQAVDALAFATDTAIRSEIRMRAAQRGVVDVDAAYALVDRANISYDDEKGVTGVDEALTQLLDTKPYLRGKAGGAPNLNSGGDPAPTPPKLTDAQRATARRFGLTDEQYAKNLPNPG